MEPVQYAKLTTAMDLGLLLDACEDAMVILVAGDTSLIAHRAVLEARSPVFAAMFSHNMLEASSSQVTIPDVEGPVLRQLLAYLYTLQAPQLPDLASQLLVAAEKYGISSLKAECERQLVAQLTVETAASTAVLAVRHGCTSLKQDAVSFMKTHTQQVMATQGWADAICMYPQDAVEVSRLVGAATAGNNSCSQTPASAVPAAVASHGTPPLDDDAAVCRLRSLPPEEKGRRLRVAAKQGEVGELEALLATGADVGAVNQYGWTALHWAAGEGREEAARRLLEAGAEVGARDCCQRTALHTAALGGHTAVVRLLLAAGADHSARTDTGRTPLHCAAYFGHREAAAALLEGGADSAARDSGAWTALDWARRNNRQQVAALLQGR